jgi:hypothetical protein
MTDTIVCPSCGSEIAVSATLATQIRQHLRQEFDREARLKDHDLARRLEAIQQQALQLEASRQSIEQEVSSRVAQEQSRLAQEAQAKAHESVALEIQDLEERLTQATDKIAETQKAELQLRRERREFEQRQQELELIVTRQVDEERATIRDQAKREVDEQNRLKEADQEKLIADLRDQIDDLKRMAEKGSPQARGEVMELVLEDFLRNSFPQDTVEHVPVSYHGGDVFQRVFDASGLECGTILWESKRTKCWSPAWLPKLRDDQRSARAQVAVLATAAMPDGLTTFACIDGIWVTNHLCLLGLAAALRQGMIEAARTKRTVEGRQTKAEILCSYLSSTEFRQRIEGIVEAFITMKGDLDSEKRSLQRLWAKREKQLERAVLNTAGLYGDFGGILGPSLPQIANLELAVIAADAEPPIVEPLEFSAENSPF